MFKEKRTGRTKEEARKKALEALKERCWRECWKENIDLPVVRETVVEIGGMFEVEIEI